MEASDPTWPFPGSPFDSAAGLYFADIFLPSRRQESRIDKCRKKTLKCINSRPFLITICVLVVVECACVLAELMVDLQGIKFRFENEETEINRFVVHLREKFPEAFADEDMRSMADVISVLEQSFNFRTKEDLLALQPTCPCPCSCNTTEARASTAADSSAISAREIWAAPNLVPDANDSFIPPDFTNWSTSLSFSNASFSSFDGRLSSGAATTKASSNSPPSTAPSSLLPLTTRSSLPLDANFSNVISSTQSTALPAMSSSPSTISNIFSTSSSSSSTTLSSSLSSSSPSVKSDTTSLKPVPPLTGSGRRKRNSLDTDGISWGIIHALHLNTTGLTDRSNPNHLTSTRELGVSTIPPEPKVTVGATEESSGYLSHVLFKALGSRTLGHVTGRGTVSPNSRRLFQESEKYTGSVAVDESVAPSAVDGVSDGLSAHSLTHSKEIYRDAYAVPDMLSSLIPVVPLTSDADKSSTSVPGISLGATHIDGLNQRIKRQAGLHADALALVTGSEDDIQSGATSKSTTQTKTTLYTTSTNANLETSAGNTSMSESSSKQTSTAEWITSSSNVTQAPKNYTAAVNSVINATTNVTTGKIEPAPSFLASPEVNKASATVNSVTQSNATATGVPVVVNATAAAKKQVDLNDIFVLEINNIIDSFFLVAEFIPHHVGSNDTKNVQYSAEYSKVYKSSKALHFISLSILSVMVLETAIKLFCTGCAFFKKKFEVFDAFIVVSSFALDFVFLDSRWYETGKDATTILVLLLPWRVVRIVNSFLMTMKHKHHIQMMNMKRARKKAELKAAKLQTLLSEVRKDVQLLVALCRSNEIEEKDITACLYGKGRRSVTLSAMSTCTSLMLISTLGKDAVQEDDIYGKVFKEALNEGDSSELNSEIQQAEEAAIDAAIELDEKIKARRKSKKYKSKKARVKRSYTVPRRTASLDIPEPDINENDSNIFYINDGYLRAAAQTTSPGSSGDFTAIQGGIAGCSAVTEEEEHQFNHTSGHGPPTQAAGRSKYQSTASVRNVPVKKGSRSNSMVIYVPEFDEPIEIPIKKQRKRKPSVHFDSNV